MPSVGASVYPYSVVSTTKRSCSDNQRKEICETITQLAHTFEHTNLSHCYASLHQSVGGEDSCCSQSSPASRRASGSTRSETAAENPQAVVSCICGVNGSNTMKNTRIETHTHTHTHTYTQHSTISMVPMKNLALGPCG